MEFFTFLRGELEASLLLAGVSELADETDSKSVIRKGVWVRVPPPVPVWVVIRDLRFLITTFNI